jgi:hypothetical protein
VTDDPTTQSRDETPAHSPSADPAAPADDPAAAPADEATPGADPARRRRRLIIGGVIAAAVVVIVLGCLAAAVVLRSSVRLADRVDDNEARHERLTEACVELETRLNRLAPPGSTGGDPRRRADAIRDENAAVRPLLAELDEMTADREDREFPRDRRRDDWAGAWRQLIEARTAYADALDRQSAAGEPAFYVAPRSVRDGSVVSELERHGPHTCGGSIRRLAGPDL